MDKYILQFLSIVVMLFHLCPDRSIFEASHLTQVRYNLKPHWHRFVLINQCSNLSRLNFLFVLISSFVTRLLAMHDRHTACSGRQTSPLLQRANCSARPVQTLVQKAPLRRKARANASVQKAPLKRKARAKPSVQKTHRSARPVRSH